MPRLCEFNGIHIFPELWFHFPTIYHNFHKPLKFILQIIHLETIPSNKLMIQQALKFCFPLAIFRLLFEALADRKILNQPPKSLRRTLIGVSAQPHRAHLRENDVRSHVFQVDYQLEFGQRNLGSGYRGEALDDSFEDFSVLFGGEFSGRFWTVKNAIMAQVILD